MALRRGFKAEAERTIQDLRHDLRLAPDKQLDPRDVAEYLGVELVAADQLVDISRLEELEEIQPGAFSACTLRPGQDRTVIVYNPVGTNGSRSAARLNSDIAHELAHIILRHKLSRLQKVGGMSFFVCDPVQEEEAGWLSACLLLPRALLLQLLRRRKSPATIARECGVSKEMVEYRINVTGVRRQLGAGSKKARKKRS